MAGCVLVACRGPSPEPQPTPATSSHLALLVETLDGFRPMEPRLTGGFAHRPCQREREPGRLLARARCSALTHEPRETIRELDKVGRALRGVRAPSAYELQAQGVWHLVWHSLGPHEVERGVEDLEGAVEKGPPDAAILSDLAAAYYLRAQERDEVLDLVNATVTALEALDQNPDLPEGRFNLALALTALGLPESARQAWDDVVRLEGPSPWGQEARRHLERLAPPSSVSSWRQAAQRVEAGLRQGYRDEGLGAVRANPQVLREGLEEDLLREWGEAWLGGEEVLARDKLSQGRRLAGLLAEVSGDPLLQDAVAVLDEALFHDDDQALTRLASAHRDFGKGRHLLQEHRPAAARGLFEHSLLLFASPRGEPGGGASRRAESPFASWAAHELAVCDYHATDYGSALDRLRGLLEDPGNEPYVVLRSRAHWMMGLVRSVEGDLTAALEHYHAARSGFQAAEERHNLGMVHRLLAEVLHTLGRPEEAWRQRLLALRSVPLQEASRAVAIFSEASLYSLEEYPRLAVLLQGELLARARPGSERAYGLLQRARTLSRLGRYAEADRDLHEVGRELANVRDPDRRRRSEGDLLLARGEVALARGDAGATASFTRALDFFGPQDHHFYLPHLYFSRARAHLQGGALDLATADLSSGIQAVQRVGSRLRGLETRLLYGESLRVAFDDMARVQLRRGDASRALLYVEQGRGQVLLDQLARLSSAQAVPREVATRHGEALPESEVSASLLPGSALLEYLLLEEESYVWVLRPGERARVVPLEGGRSQVESRAQDFVDALGGGTEDELAVASRRLFHQVLRPALESLPAQTHLVVVPDRALHKIPFAALLDPDTDRYVVEDYALSLAPSAAAYVAARRRSRPVGDPRVLLVGNPVTPGDSTLAPLPAATAEVADIAAHYRDLETLVLTGTDATASRFLAHAPRSTVVHYAGHAVSLPRSPLLSYLVFHPDSELSSGHLLASRLYDQRFARTSLVVLAACSTAGPVSETEGVLGLVRPFLAAGVPAVIASLWPVDDEGTRRLFATFHQTLASGVDAASALRSAQLTLLRGSQPRHRSPRVWSAFQLYGVGETAVFEQRGDSL